MIAIDPRSRKPVTATATDKDGNYSLITLVGVVQVRPVATGLRLVDVKRTRAGRLDFVLGINAEAQTLIVREKTKQHVLRFRMTDSIWPEFVPPSKVRAWMRFSWGIDPMQAMCGQLPYSVCKRRSQLPDYWWLRVVEGTPPNPATTVDLE